MIVAGLGCRRRCTAEAIVAVVHAAARKAGVQPEALAAPVFKRDEPGLLAAAETLGLRLFFIADDALAAVQARCPTRSAAASNATGHASIAEAAALAASNGPLLLPRIAQGGATCAIAGSVHGPGP